MIWKKNQIKARLELLIPILLIGVPHLASANSLSARQEFTDSHTSSRSLAHDDCLHLHNIPFHSFQTPTRLLSTIF